MIALRKFDQALQILNKKMEEEQPDGFTITSLDYSKPDLMDISKIVSANFTPTAAEPNTANISPKGQSPTKVYEE